MSIKLRKMLNTYLKRNKQIKLFTIGWILLMIIIAIFLLLRVPSSGNEGSEKILISGEDNLKVAQIGVLPSPFLDRIVAIIEGYDTKYTIIILENSTENCTCGNHANLENSMNPEDVADRLICLYCFEQYKKLEKYYYMEGISL